MYIPEHFALNDREALWQAVAAYPFATLVTADDGAPLATQVPLVRDGVSDRLIGHVARANPQWRHFDGRPALAIFHGPHAYISPSWYAAAPAVPTWNYLSVHAAGPIRAVDEPDRTRETLRALTAVFEPGEAWRFETLPDEFLARLQRGIVAFELEVATLEGKAKLSQNKTAADRAGVLAALRAAGDPEGLAVADLMDPTRPG